MLVSEKQRVSSRGVESTGLSEREIENAKTAYRNETDPPRSSDRLNYPDRVYRTVRSRPLLVVHLLAIGKQDENLCELLPTVAWSISFPRTKFEDKKVEYVVNTTWFLERYQEEADEEEEDGDDE